VAAIEHSAKMEEQKTRKDSLSMTLRLKGGGQIELGAEELLLWI